MPAIKTQTKTSRVSPVKRNTKVFPPKPIVNCHHGPTNTFIIATPIGDLQLECCPKGIHLLNASGIPNDSDFNPDPSVSVCVKNQMYEDNGYTYKPSLQCVQWLQNYFEGSQAQLPPICHLKQPNMKFTQKVWQTLADEVMFGNTVTYGELARMCGNAKASQAVGQAMRTNPVMLIVPCHRVILGSGHVGNYSGGKRNSVKHWLLVHEGALQE